SYSVKNGTGLWASIIVHSADARSPADCGTWKRRNEWFPNQAESCCLTPAEDLILEAGRRGERAGHVVLPGKALLVGQAPQQSQPAAQHAQAGAGKTQPSLARLWWEAIEVDQPELRPAHAAGLRARQSPHQSVGEGQYR